MHTFVNLNTPETVMPYQTTLAVKICLLSFTGNYTIFCYKKSIDQIPKYSVINYFVDNWNKNHAHTKKITSFVK